MTRESIIAIAMPGFGTVDDTHNASRLLAESLGVTFIEQSVGELALYYLNLAGHQGQIDVAYENVQAWVRKQVELVISAVRGGIVFGSGTLSELLLGWTTYLGDQASHLGLNIGIAKNTIPVLLRYQIEHTFADNPGVVEAVETILSIPSSPQLKPPSKTGEIEQVTEDIVGPYELHDFFAYNMLRFGMSVRKIAFLAFHAFEGQYSLEEIWHWLRVMLQRMFPNQFKRNSLAPDGPMIGSVNLSPRENWKMPSDVQVRLWLEQLADFPQLN